MLSVSLALSAAAMANSVEEEGEMEVNSQEQTAEMV